MATVIRSFRLSTALDARLLAEAARQDRSASWMIVRALEAALPDETPRPSPAGREDGFGFWLAGFIDGEGCFTIGRNTVRGTPSGYRCRMTLRLRNDDQAVLSEIVERTGIGSVRQDKRPEGENPQVVWEVASKSGCVALCNLLDAHPLRAKKARDYLTWREAVRVQEGITGRNQNLGEDPAQATLATLKRQLESGRAYVPAIVGEQSASRPSASPRASTRKKAAPSGDGTPLPKIARKHWA